MPITYTANKMCYDVVMSEIKVEGKGSMQLPQPVPTPHSRIGKTINVKSPWRCQLQSGGWRRHRMVFGKARYQEYQNYVNSKAGDIISLIGAETTGHTISKHNKLFAWNKVDGQYGLTDDMNDMKIGDLFHHNPDDCSVVMDFDFSLGADGRKERIESLNILDKNGCFKNPMTSVIPSVPIITEFDSDRMPGNNDKVYCTSFWPSNLNTYDQLFKDWSQIGYIKFAGDTMVIPKRGTKDILIVNNKVRFLPQAGHEQGNSMDPNRPYELKSNIRTLDSIGSAIIIHLWRR